MRYYDIAVTQLVKNRYVLVPLTNKGVPKMKPNGRGWVAKYSEDKCDEIKNERYIR